MVSFYDLNVLKPRLWRKPRLRLRLVSLLCVAQSSAGHDLQANYDFPSWECPTRQHPFLLRCSPKGDGCSAPGAWGVESANHPWSVSCRESIIRLEVRNGDTWWKDNSRDHAAERDEISLRQKFPPDADIWYSFSMLVEPGPATSSKWLEAGQLHSSPDPGEPSPSPPVTQGFDANDIYRILIRSTSEKPISSNPAPIFVYRDSTFKRGVFYNFVYHVHYGLKDGRAEVWRNGQRIVSYSGPIGYHDAKGPYFKIGIYRLPAAETFAIQIANLEVGEADLSSRIRSPIPIDR